MSERRVRRTRRSVVAVAIVPTLLAGSIPYSAGAASVDEVSTALGSTQAIFDFVARDIRYEPYSGVLRGPDDTLAGRAGNSADQALLLARLLEAAGVEHRFAFGPIDPAVSEALLASAGVDRETAREAVLRGMSGRLPGDTEVPLATDAGDDDGVEQWVTDQVTGTAELIATEMWAAGIDLAAGFSEVPDTEVDQHVWVQARVDGEWVDLDPSLSSSEMGQSLATAAETTADVPEELHHIVELAVVGEHLADGALVAEDLLTVSGMAWEFAGQPIVIGNADEAALPVVAGRFEAVLDVATYRPLISVGESAYVGRPFTLGAGSEGSMGGLGGGFFDPGAAAPEATGQWVELRMTAPGQEPVTVRREVFDRVGPGGRTAGDIDLADLASLTLVDGGDPSAPLIADLEQVSFLVLATSAPAFEGPVRELDADVAEALSIVPLAHHEATEIASHDVLARTGLRPFVDAPNVTALTSSLTVDDAGTPSIATAIDIWHRSRGVLPVAGLEAPDDPAIYPGVLAHVTERLLAGEARPEAGRQFFSVGALFDAAAAQGIGLEVLDSADAVGALPYPESARLLLERSLAEGWRAIVPERPVSIADGERVGWWLVDPETGRVADEADDGRGISATYSELAIAAVGAATPIYTVGILGCALLDVAAVNIARLRNVGFNLGAYNAQAPTARWFANNVMECVSAARDLVPV